MSERDGFYAKAIAVLKREKVPFLLGGAFALRHYTGIHRDTKDMDLFVREEDCASALRVLENEGYIVELTDVLWLGKAFHPSKDHFIDIIFNSGNGLGPVDDIWFNEAEQATVFGQRVCVIPPEEMIFSKSFIMARDRFDGADISHLILVVGQRLNWQRVLKRFGEHWPVLLSQLILFTYVYPSKVDCIPRFVLEDLLYRFQLMAEETKPISRGPLLDRVSYERDSALWGLVDVRRSA